MLFASGLFNYTLWVLYGGCLLVVFCWFGVTSLSDILCIGVFCYYCFAVGCVSWFWVCNSVGYLIFDMPDLC